MDPRLIPQMLAAMAFFGLFAVFPLVMLFLRHQRAMAELIHRNAGGDAQQRIEMLEREVRELRSANQERILREDDQQQLSRRTTHEP